MKNEEIDLTNLHKLVEESHENLLNLYNNQHLSPKYCLWAIPPSLNLPLEFNPEFSKEQREIHIELYQLRTQK